VEQSNSDNMTGTLLTATQERRKQMTKMTKEAAARIAKSTTDTEFVERATQAATKNEK
jgi:hypothetical protein